MPFIRSISGIRATVADSLNEKIIQQYCYGFSDYLPQGSITVGYDGRPTGVWIAECVITALKKCGREVVYLGIAPTPTVQLLTEHNKTCVGGISISASHNPIEWNGLKFIGGDGVFLDSTQNEDFWKITDSLSENRTSSESEGQLTEKTNALTTHIDSIINNPIFDTQIKKLLNKTRSIRVVVDAVNASGSLYIPQLLRKLGCDVIELFCKNDGDFPHTPEPLPENLSLLCDAVKEHKADLGIAVDPDADRLVLIDENGVAIGEERTIVLSVLSALILAGTEKNAANVVVNLSTTKAVNDVCAMYGAQLHRTPVGEINVVRKMQEVKALIGGEGSGGVIFPHSHYGRDSLVGTALIIVLISIKEKKLSEINKEIPTYSMKKTKMEFSGDFATIREKIVKEFAPKEYRTDDGIYFTVNNSWLHVRASNTEPIARIIAESPTEEENNALILRAFSACQ